MAMCTVLDIAAWNWTPSHVFIVVYLPINVQNS